MGIVLGVLFGKINISFSDSLSFSPGLTGGVLMVALVLSAIGMFGLEKSKRSLPVMLSLAFTLIKLAIQTGSCKALRLEGCSVHVLPKSFVVATARLPPRLSRIFSINTPGSTSATCASVVFVRAKLCRCHVFPRSLLYIMPALGTRVASINWMGKTKVGGGMEIIMSKTKGRVTLPSESNFLNETKEMLDRWGADALRDSDGTKLDAATKALDAKIYTTFSGY